MTSGETIRLLLVLHYDGSRFFGWQIQPERRTVQGVLQAAAEELTESQPTVTGSGRTDRGVHATGQVASLLVPSGWSAASFRRALNAILPPDVWVERAFRVPEAFHPRYDARARSYEYRLGLAEAAASPFHRPFCWLVEQPLRQDLLHRAAEEIPGGRSFEAFAKSGQPSRGTRSYVYQARWEPWTDLGLTFTITAVRYLHHMVRYLVGTMVSVAQERRSLDELRTLLSSGPTPELWTSAPAPPQGLYLARVEYPAEALGAGGPGYDQESEMVADLTTESQRRTSPAFVQRRAD